MASLTTETTTTTSWSKELLRIDTEINTQRTLRDAADKDTSPESDVEEDRITKVIRGLKKERSNIGQQMADQMQAISALQVKFGFAVAATALATGETKDVEEEERANGVVVPPEPAREGLVHRRKKNKKKKREKSTSPERNKGNSELKSNTAEDVKL